jgi:hypothetical protein
LSSFQVASTGVNFDVVDASFSDKGGALEEITATLIVANATDWGALFSLRSWNVSQRSIAGGDTTYVDIGGGAGAGSLSIDNLDSHNAVMTAISRDYVEPGSLRSRATATWLITG